MKTYMIAIAITVIALALLPLSSRADFEVPTNGLIGYWTGNGNALDSSSVGNNGSFSGSYVPGPTGEAFNLGSAKVTMPYVPAYNFTSYSGWSVGFWFNGNGTSINPNTGLFLGEDNGSGYQPKWFIDYGYSVYGSGPYFYFHVNDYNQERIFINSDTESFPSGWNQLTITINNTNNGTVDFYLNGQPIGSGALGNYVLETTAPLVFGAAESPFAFNGLMSDVVIYDRALSTNEILQLATVPTLTITGQPGNVTVSTGGTATFSVGATGGYPPFSYQWAVNGTNISGATNSTLILTNVTPAEVGVYTVSVANSVGSPVTSAGATLTTADIAMFAGIIINGVVGTNYTIEATRGLQTNWMTQANFTLPSVPYIYIDYSSYTNPGQFYQVFALP